MKLSTKLSRGATRPPLGVIASFAAVLIVSAWGAGALAQGAPPPPAATPAPAPTAADTSKIVATVNGDPITEFDISLAEQDFADQLQQIPLLQQRQALIDALVDLKVIKQAAEKASLDQSEAFKQRLEFLRERALRTEYVNSSLATSVTDDVVKKRYDQEVANLVPADQIKASDILVKTSDEAKAIITQLKAGADFAEIAKAKSQDPDTAPNGGDLGYISKGTMVPEFDAAAFALEPGQITETPVKTDAGYYVIKLIDKKKQDIPTFDQVKDQIRQLVLSDAYSAAVQKLRTGADVKILEADPMQGLIPIPGAAGGGGGGNGGGR